MALALLFAVGPSQALAAGKWLPGETLDAPGAADAPDVATDNDGNSVAVWLAGGEVRASYRPRAGDWGTPESLDTGTEIFESQPRVTVQPDNGQFVAVWVAAAEGGPLRWARRPRGGDWSAPATITNIGSLPGIAALEASADGGVLVMPTDEGSPSTNFKPRGSEEWGPDEDVPTGQGTRLAMAPDGSAVVAAATSCGSEPPIPCILSAYRPPDGPWGEVVEAARLPTGRQVTGFELASAYGVALTPTFSLVWGEATNGAVGPESPGSVRSVDRGVGPGGGWGAQQTVTDLADEIPFCNSDNNCFDLVTSLLGAQLAAWHQTGDGTNRIMTSLRGPGGPWGPTESAGDTGTSGAVPFAGIVAAPIPTTNTPVIAWGSNVTGEGIARGSYRDDAGWHPVELGGGGLPPEDGVFLGDLDVDGDGNAVTAWRDPSGVSAAGFDAGPPRFSAFSVPAGSAGQTLGFSAAADDNWSGPPQLSWLFGDGGEGFGSPVSHVYGAPGTYSVTATATDGLGNIARRGDAISPTATPAPTPGPDPCGTGDKDKDGIKDTCDTSDGSSRPVAFKTVNARVVSGEVFVKLPAGAARASQATKPPKGFVRLTVAQTIPVGSTLDTAKGRVSLRTASDTRKHVQTAEFFRGRFLVRQVRKPRGKAKKRSTKLITELRLVGSSFSKACRAKASISQKKRSKKRVRRLFGDGKGSFRTRGRNAAATVRGTRWGVQDRCDGTLVTVQRGRVEVRDLVKRKTVIVRTGKTYLARRR